VEPIQTDAGMSRIRSLLLGRRPEEEAEDETGPPPGPGAEAEAAAGLAVVARLGASIDGLCDRLDRQARIDRAAWKLVHPIEPAGSQSAAAGPISDERWGPQSGWAWRVFGVSVTLGAGATRWDVYYDSPNDPTNWIFGAATSSRWEPSHFYLMPERSLVFTGTGGGITVSKWAAAEIDVRVLAWYLGLKQSG
jgi:hypothetical protein